MNEQCQKSVFMFGSEELWQELIRTRKELEQSEICCAEWAKQALDYKAENIALSGKLELTRKALDVAKDALYWIDETYQTCQELEADIWAAVQLTEEKISELEQKDV